MVWMTSFCFCCTVRLGVTFSAILSIAFKFGECMVYVIHGDEIIPKTVEIIENDPELNDNFVWKPLAKYMKFKQSEFILVIIIESVIYIITCILCIIGTYKLKKWFLLPYIILQFIFVMRALIVHVTAMLVIKKDVNLGVLIGLTIFGGFVVLLFGYQWSAAVGMFQIINLVKSPKYKLIYGDDPLYPIDLQLSNDLDDSVENIKIFTTPNYDEVDTLKSLNSLAAVKQKFNTDLAIIGNTNDENDLRNFWHINELVGIQKKNIRLNRMENNTVGYF